MVALSALPLWGRRLGPAPQSQSWAAVQVGKTTSWMQWHSPGPDTSTSPRDRWRHWAWHIDPLTPWFCTPHQRDARPPAIHALGNAWHGSQQPFLCWGEQKGQHWPGVKQLRTKEQENSLYLSLSLCLSQPVSVFILLENTGQSDQNRLQNLENAVKITQNPGKYNENPDLCPKTLENTMRIHTCAKNPGKIGRILR